MRNSSRRISTLDLARGLAAFAVCAGHLRAAMFVSFGQLPATSIVQKSMYAMTGLGHQAVMVFFVLSGYFVGGSVLKQDKQFQWLTYAVSRLTRLWVVLIPALLFTWLVDQAINVSHPEVLAGAFNGIWASGPDSSSYSRGADVFIGNVLFQQTVLVPVYGTNSPLWSLSNEFYYYLLFPALLLSIGYFGRRKNTGLRLLLGLASMVALSLLPVGFAEGFLVFCMGALVALLGNKSLLSKRPSARKYATLAGSLAFLISLYLSKRNISFGFLSQDILVGVGFSLFLIPLSDSTLPFIRFRRFAAFFSDISYSLYLAHFPVVLLIASTYYGADKIRPDFIGMCQFVGWLSVVVLVAIVFWSLFEKQTDVLRGKILLRLNRRPPRSDVA